MACKRFLFGTDSHGDMLDKQTAKQFLLFAKDWKPHIKIHGGDVFDFRPLREGAGAEEKSESMENDVLAGMQFLAEYQPGVILTGNHDIRLWKKAESKTNGIMRDLCRRLVWHIEEDKSWSNAMVFPYDVREGVYQVGSLSFVHGYYAGMNAAKQTINLYKGTCTGVIAGHVHSFDSYSDMGLVKAVGMTCGMLGKIDMPYNEKTPRKLAYSNGWYFGEVYERKSGNSPWAAWSVRKEGNIWLNPLRTK